MKRNNEKGVVFFMALLISVVASFGIIEIERAIHKEERPALYISDIKITPNASREKVK